MEAHIVKNCSGRSLRLKSSSSMHKDIQLGIDAQYMFKSPAEHQAYVKSMIPWIQIKKLELETIRGAKAETKHELDYVDHNASFKDFDEDQQESITVKDVDIVNKETELNASEETQGQQSKETESDSELTSANADLEPEADLAVEAKKELEDLQLLLKDNSDPEAKKKLNARIKELKKMLKN